jgi:hypothetical protein
VGCTVLDDRGHEHIRIQNHSHLISPNQRRRR